MQLEKELAKFVGKDEALCFSTGFTVNSGVIACLTGREDYIICDDRDHASIVDGRRLSFQQVSSTNTMTWKTWNVNSKSVNQNRSN